jgi:hypothetical protein
MHLTLKLKLDFYKRLPWSLFALALPCEESARVAAEGCLQTFDRDPRVEAHHRQTFALLRKGSDFRTGLEDFVSGKGLFEVHPRFSLVVSSFRFIPVVETTIEAKHAQIALKLKTHLVGPVRISLANRTPMLERRLALDPSFFEPLIKSFSSARVLSSVPIVLGLSEHPDIVACRGLRKKAHPSKLKVVLSRVLYRCDLANAFFSLRKQIRADKHLKDKRKRDQLKLAAVPLLLCEAEIFNKAAREHLREVCPASV